MALEARRTRSLVRPGENWYSFSMPSAMKAHGHQIFPVWEDKQEIKIFMWLLFQFLKDWSGGWGGGLFCRRVKYSLCPQPPACDFCPGHEKSGIGLSRSPGKNRSDQPRRKQPRFCCLQASWCYTVPPHPFQVLWAKGFPAMARSIPFFFFPPHSPLVIQSLR